VSGAQHGPWHNMTINNIPTFLKESPQKENTHTKLLVKLTTAIKR